MNDYKQQLKLYFDLKGTSPQTIEGYERKIDAFIKFVKDKNSNKDIEDISISDVQASKNFHSP